MRDVIVHCYKIMNKTLSPEFRKQYAKGLRSFVDAYPDMDTCAVISRDISRLNGEEIDIEEAMDPVGKEDGDIDNDGDKDDSDEYLAKRRKAIAKAIKNGDK